MQDISPLKFQLHLCSCCIYCPNEKVEYFMDPKEFCGFKNSSVNIVSLVDVWFLYIA